MAEHEPKDIASKDKAQDTSRKSPASDITAVASEPMELQRLPDNATRSVPPGRQRTGDPPEARPKDA